MRKYKQLFSMFLILVLMFQVLPFPVQGQEFADINNHWAKADLQKAVDSKLLTGYPDGTIKPENQITRAEFVTMVNKAMNKPSTVNLTFSDVKSTDWFFESVRSCFGNKYINGYNDNTFRPDNSITREEVAVIIAKMLNLSETQEVATFKDKAGISTWAKNSINALIKQNLMKGYPNNTFKPQNLITRAEAVVALNLAINYNTLTIHGVGTPNSEGGGGGGGGGGSDNTPPVVTITTPTSEPTLTTRETVINLSGTASDNRSVTSVVYAVYAGLTGTAVGTTNWSINNLDLLPGENVIAVTATDAAGNKTTDTITVNYDMGHVAPFNRADVISDAATGQELIKNQILITFKEEVTEQTINSKVYAIGGEIVGYLSGLNEYQVQINNNPTLQDLKDLIALLTEDSDVDSVILNYLSEAQPTAIPNDEEWFTGFFGDDTWNEETPSGRNWGLEAIYAPSAWEHNSELQKVKLGIMDGGFYINHADLQIPEKNASGTNSTFESTADDYQGYESPAAVALGNNTHGTHVAGTIGALANNTTGITGIVWNKDIYPYRIQFNAPIFEYKYGFYWLLEHKTKVINCSFGYHQRDTSNPVDIGDKELWTKFLKKLINRGYDFMIVQAAGNDGIDAKYSGFFNGIDDPVVKSRVMVVGAIEERFSDEGDMVGYGLTDFSSFGPQVDVVAPGQDIFSTYTADGYNAISGTSMAAPHVTGVVGLVWAMNPNLTAPQVKQIVTDTADRPITKDGLWYKILNADAAVNRAKSTEATQPMPEESTGILMGNVVDAATNDGISNATISVFGVSEEAPYTASTVSENDGSFELILEPGTYLVYISKDGYLSTYSYEVITEGVTVYSPTIRAIDNESTGDGTVEGTITNAFDGHGISNLAIDFREGLNNTTGEVVATTVTADGGLYAAELPAGNYTAKVTGEGYVPGYFYVVSVGGEILINQNGTVTPILPEGQTRIILTWGETPTDLDSHLIGPALDGELFHTFYGEKTFTVGDQVYADLDLDDVTSYGPETTTIYNQTTGTYSFYIHDYTNRDSANTTALADSGAIVKVYKGDTFVATYNVPANMSGNVWKVFEINGDTITPINEMSYNYPGYTPPTGGGGGDSGSAIAPSRSSLSGATAPINFPPKR